MEDFKKIQKAVYANKIKQGFNVTDVHLEFNLAYGELAEAFEAYYKSKPGLGEELADVAIYLFGIAEIMKIDLGEEIVKKVEKNSKREYKKINGVSVRIDR